MVDVAQYINEVKRDSDTLHIIDDIQVLLFLLQTMWKYNHDSVKKRKFITVEINSKLQLL